MTDVEIEARHVWEKKFARSSPSETCNEYMACLSLRAIPVQVFLAGDPKPIALPVTSIMEGRLLVALGIPRDERNQIQGLQQRGSVAEDDKGENSLAKRSSTRALVRLASNPPPMAGHIQRRTSTWLLRPYPNGTGAHRERNHTDWVMALAC